MEGQDEEFSWAAGVPDLERLEGTARRDLHHVQLGERASRVARESEESGMTQADQAQVLVHALAKVLNSGGSRDPGHRRLVVRAFAMMLEAAWLYDLALSGVLG